MKDQQVLDDSNWRTWLRELGKDIRGRKRQITRTGRVVYPGSDTPDFAGGRKLTYEEWGLVQDLIRAHDLIVVPRNACMGFGCAITVYEERPPVYPGVPPMPKKLIDITQDQLPAGPDGPKRFDRAWDQFSVFTHTDRNKERAKREGFGEIRDKFHYEY